jgi:putative RecB family exonuclease
MYIENVSPSKIKVFQECKLKYKLKYIDRVPDDYNPNSSKDALQFGSYIHKILEDGVGATTEKELWDIASSIREQYVFGEQKEKLTGKCITNFLAFNSQLSDTVSTEQFFSVKFKDFTLNGIIDRVVKGKEGGYLVIDYKTSKRAMSQRDLYTDPQMIMYAAAVNKQYDVPFDKITVSHYYPHLDKFVTVKYTAATVNSYLNGKLKPQIWDIRKRKLGQFPPVPNRFCDWCGYRDICPAAGGSPMALTEAINKAGPARRAVKKKSNP